MIPISIVSTARTATRSEWATAAVPFEDVPLNSRFGRLVKTGWTVAVGRALGKHTRLLNIYCDGIAPGEEVLDTVQWTSDNPRIEASPWVTDAPAKLIPLPLIHTAEGAKRVDAAQVEGFIESRSEVEMVYRVQARIPDQPELFWRAYLYLFGVQPVVPFDWQLVHSLTGSAAYEVPVRNIFCVSGEPHMIDFAKMNGVVGGLRQIRTGEWATHLQGAVDIWDGTRISYQGKILALPDEGGFSVDSPEAQTLIAASEGPLLAIGGVWHKKWLGLREVAEDPGGNHREEILNWWDGVHQWQDYWAVRMEGLQRQPGMTGDQQAFNATKGSEAVSQQDPLWIPRYVHNITGHMRPSAYYEPDMRTVKREGHPGWTTWSGQTHETGSDYLGKPLVGGRIRRGGTNGWLATDEQHNSGLWEAAGYALTGRLWIRDLLRENAEVWLASHNESAPRAIGRTWRREVNSWRLLDDPRILREVHKDFDAMVLGFQAKVKGPWKHYQQFFDPRALVDENGDPVPGIIHWQHGIGGMGIWAAHLATGSVKMKEAFIDMMACTLKTGWFRRADGRWTCADYTFTNDGYPLDPADYANDGNVPGKTHTTGWFTWWVIGATARLVDLIRRGEAPQYQDLLAKGESIVAQFRPRNWRQSQWLAM